MPFLRHKGAAYGVLLAASSAVATGTFGVFLNYFDSLGISENAMSTFTPLAVFAFYLIYTLITQPKVLKLPRKLFYFTLIVCSGMIASPIYIYTSIRSFNSLPIAVASLLDFSNAIVLVFLMRIFFKSKITKEKLIACVIAVFGMVLVLNLFNTHVSDITTIGIFWGLANCFSLAFAYLFDYYHISNGVSYLAYLVYSNAMGLIVFSFKTTPAEVFREFAAASPSGGLTMWLMLLGYFAVLVISYGTIAVSYNYIEASTASLTFVLEPTTAALLGFMVLSQHLGSLQIVGMVIAVAAIVYMQYTGDKADEVQAKENEKKKVVQNE
ncbi:MAG: EamA family transporter [Eubacterium limosum]|nr:EamA family transporter [Eubacterium limosum]